MRPLLEDMRQDKDGFGVMAGFTTWGMYVCMNALMDR